MPKFGAAASGWRKPLKVHRVFLGHDETCKYFTQWNHKKKGVFVVTVDLHLLSSQLLERLANAIYERDLENPTPFFFNTNELKITQDFLETLLKEKAAWD